MPWFISGSRDSLVGRLAGLIFSSGQKSGDGNGRVVMGIHNRRVIRSDGVAGGNGVGFKFLYEHFVLSSLCLYILRCVSV